MCWKRRFCLLHDDLNVDLGSLDFIMKTDSWDMPLFCSQSYNSLHHFHFIFHVVWSWDSDAGSDTVKISKKGGSSNRHDKDCPWSCHHCTAGLVAGWLVRLVAAVYSAMVGGDSYQPRGCRRLHTNLPISRLVLYAIHTFKLMVMIGEY